MKALAQHSPKNKNVPHKRSSSPEFRASPQSFLQSVPILQRKTCVCGGHCLRCQKKSAERVESKLKISSPNDKYEQEADRVAHRIIRRENVNSDGRSSGGDNNISSIQKAVAENPNEEPSGRPVETLLERQKPPLTQDSPNNGMRILSDSGQRYFEPLVGSTVNNARLHVNALADQLTRLAKAKALTYGNDVFIPRNRFSARSVEGRTEAKLFFSSGIRR